MAFKTFMVDWGQSRRQGRRSGGQVTGAMADPPRGGKTYIDYRGSVPGGLSDQEWEEARLFGDDYLSQYVRDRQYGATHHDACVRVYRAMEASR